MTQVLPGASNPVERAFYNLNTRVDVMGRAAKGHKLVDPTKALKEAKAVEAALKEFKATCRQEIADRKAAAAAHKVAEAERVAYEAAIRAAREAAAAARAATSGQINPNFERDGAVEGLVVMARAAQEDRAITVNVGGKQRGVLARILPIRRKQAA